MTQIVHMPETKAENPSALRERAYSEGIPIALPVLDSGGWKALPPVKAVGTLIPNADVTARLSIANPVRSCYLHFTVATLILFGAVVICTGYTDTVIPRAI
jgi:hypothetical protein